MMPKTTSELIVHFSSSFQYNIFIHSICRSLYESFEPKTVADIVLSLQRKCGLRMPVTDEDWIGIPRTPVDIRRSVVVKDAIREARKPRFDATKLLKVSVLNYQECNGL